MTLFFGILTFFVILAVLILVHEFGHFTFAKLFGVRVDEFGLGFPPRLKSWRRGETLYSLNAIPLGGFVKMAGENGEDTEPDSFGTKRPWQRFIILVAGPSMNLMLAVAIFFFAFVIGSPRGLTIVTSVANGSPAAVAGLKPGDRILAVDGKPVHYYEDMASAVESHLGQRVVLSVKRGSHRIRIALVPRQNPPPNEGAMGVLLGRSVTVSYPPGTALPKAVQSVWLAIVSVPQGLQQAFEHGGQGLSGPIGIAHTTTQVVQAEPNQGPGGVFELMALLSASLGVLNLLPIPALDGGRLVFVLISWVRRRNLDPRVESIIHLAGMTALLFLIVLISYQDIVHWVKG